jgi:hypothetical protein
VHSLIVAALIALSHVGATASHSDHAIRTGGVNIEPAIRPFRFAGPNPDGWWCQPGECAGVSNGTRFVDREVPLGASTGARILRLDLPWAFVEPQRGVFHWRRADYIVAKVRKAHLQIHAILAYSPSWAAPSENDAPASGDFAAFARAVARRYRGRIRYYELWNEPDLTRYWNASETAYVQDVLVPGDRAIKKADPNARVVLGGPSHADRDWLNGIFRLGGGSAFDIASYHDYSGDQRVLSDARVVKDVLVANGRPRTPIWLGEYGFQEPAIDDVQHAALIHEVLTQPAPIAVAEWYELRDDSPMTCCPPTPLELETYGLFTDDYRPKTSLKTMQALLRRR